MDEGELREQELHDKRMDRLQREREEKEAMRAEIERLRAENELLSHTNAAYREFWIATARDALASNDDLKERS